MCHEHQVVKLCLWNSIWLEMTQPRWGSLKGFTVLFRWFFKKFFRPAPCSVPNTRSTCQTVWITWSYMKSTLVDSNTFFFPSFWWKVIWKSFFPWGKRHQKTLSLLCCLHTRLPSVILIGNWAQREEDKTHTRCTDLQPCGWAWKHTRNPKRLQENGESQSRVWLSLQGLSFPSTMTSGADKLAKHT